MNKYKGKVETAKKGFLPKILDHDLDHYFGPVLDNSYVEYGTGCWVDKGSNPSVALESQVVVYEVMKESVPLNHFVFNTCSDYRVCYNPNCLATMEAPDYEAERT